MPKHLRRKVQIRADHVEYESKVVELPEMTFEQRTASLRSELPQLPDSDLVALMLCDGCGETTAVDPRTPVLPVYWTQTPDGDYCAKCSSQSHQPKGNHDG